MNISDSNITDGFAQSNNTNVCVRKSTSKSVRKTLENHVSPTVLLKLEANRLQAASIEIKVFQNLGEVLKMLKIKMLRCFKMLKVNFSRETFLL